MPSHLIRRDVPNLTPVRSDFFTPFEQVFDEFFNNFFRNSSTLDKIRTNGGYPKMDIFEQDGYLTVQAAIPGVKTEDINVEIIPIAQGSVLRVSGKMSEELQSDGKYQIHELKKSVFSRSIVLPEWVKDDPTATMKNGILILRWKVPIAEEPAAPPIRRVTIVADKE